MNLRLTLLISLLIPLSTFAAPPMRPILGSVHQIEGDQLQVCFKNAAPAVGTALASQAGYVPYKSSGATVYRTIGHARVIAVETSCATAELTDGHAKRYDHVIVVSAIAAKQGDCPCPC